MKLSQIYSEYKVAKPTLKPNQYKLPKIQLTLDKFEDFNELLAELVEMEKTGDTKRGIVRTPSGGICTKPHINVYRGNCYDVVAANSFVSITVLHCDGMFQVVWSNKDEMPDNGIGGAQAFNRFKKVCFEYGVDLEDYSIPNGLEVKQQIPKPRIGVTNKCFLGLTFRDAHHIDLNTAYMAGIAKAFPQLLEPITYIYNNRKKPGLDNEFKAILNYSYGYMQSKYHNYRHAHMSLAGHLYCNQMLDDITAELKAHDCCVIAYNTDGIWFTGDCDWIENSNELGKFKVDHKNCKLRFKSNGAYEYIEDGKYTPVIRGKTRYDNIKPRSQWEWGDIYRDDCTIIKYYFEGYEKGIVKYESKA